MKFLPIMNDVFDDLFYDSFKNYSNVNAMRTDICEQNDQYLLNMELPGFKKEDIKLDCEKGYLTVSANKEFKKEEHEGKKYIRRERTSTKFARSFYLDDADEDSIEATFKDGTLHVVVAKKEQSKDKKYIEIK